MNKSRAGFTLLEPLLAGALLSLTTLTIVTGLVAGQHVGVAFEERAHALFLAQEGVEVVRNLRDGSIDELPVGEWGLTLEGGAWELIETSDTTDDYYTRTITIAEPEADERHITVRVSWETGLRQEEVSLQTFLTNWR